MSEKEKITQRGKLIKQIDKEIARLENEIEGLVSEKLELEAEQEILE